MKKSLNPYTFLKQASNPWFWGAWFAIILTLLSYAPLLPELKNSLVFMGILLPLLLAAVQAVRSEAPGPEEWTWLQPWKITFFIFAAALILSRFLYISQSPSWPLMDEGRNAFFSMELARHWSWRLLWGEPQEEPLLNWKLAMFFKLFGPSPFSIRLFPALVSLATLVAGYWASRRVFSKSTAFLVALLLGFSFWPFTFSRLLLRVTLLLFLEILALGLLASFLRENRPSQKFKSGLALAAVTGLGFYSYTAWPVVALFITVVLGWDIFLKSSKKKSLLSLTPPSPTRGEGDKQHLLPQGEKDGMRVIDPAVFYRSASPGLYSRNNGGIFILFLALTGLLAFPLVWVRLHSGGLEFVRLCFNPSDFFRSFARYVIGIFYFGYGSAPYGPNWGGFLNPLLGSFTLLGILSLFARKKFSFLGWSALAFVLALLPGALTGNVEMHRVTAVLPLLLIFCALGFQHLLSRLPGKTGPWVFGLLFFLSLGLDFYHFTGPYQDWKSLPEDKRGWRSIERLRAFQILKETTRTEGPIAVMDEFSPPYGDQTLKIAAYPFDLTQNAGLFPRKCRWMALLANSNYEPFLKTRFPEGRWTWLAPDFPTRNGGMMLGLIPVDEKSKSLFEQWWKANQSMRGITSLLLNARLGESRAPIQEALREIYPNFQGDPFLESAYWEKRGLLDAMDSNLSAVVEDCRQAVSKGYPAANLYHEMGIFLNLQGQKKEALEAFQKAVKAPINHTPAQLHIQELDEEINKNNQRVIGIVTSKR